MLKNKTQGDSKSSVLETEQEASNMYFDINKTEITKDLPRRLFRSRYHLSIGIATQTHTSKRLKERGIFLGLGIE